MRLACLALAVLAGCATHAAAPVDLHLEYGELRVQGANSAPLLAEARTAYELTVSSAKARLSIRPDHQPEATYQGTARLEGDTLELDLRGNAGEPLAMECHRERVHARHESAQPRVTCARGGDRDEGWTGHDEQLDAWTCRANGDDAVFAASPGVERVTVLCCADDVCDAYGTQLRLKG